MPSRTVYRLFWIPSAIAIVGMTALFARQPTSLPTPDQMKPYINSDKTISLERPANWKAHTLGLHGISFQVRFEPARNISIKFTTDLTGSLMADINRAAPSVDLSGVPGMENTTEKKKSPLELAHQRQRTVLEKEFAGQNFEESGSTPAQVAGLEAISSDFSFQESTLFGKTNMVGKRFTILGVDKELLIIYQCPKESQEQIVPVFDKMIATVQLGQGG